jgi:hypothetical protein
VSTCPLCDGQLLYLGQLGRRIHYRCRDCGMECSQDVADTYDDDGAIWDQFGEEKPA